MIEFRAFYWRSLNKLNASVGLKAYDPATSATEPVDGKKPEAK